MQDESVEWVQMYTIAREYLHWSDKEFWEATPRKYWAVFYSYLDMKTADLQPEVLSGDEALKSLKVFTIS